MRQTKQQKRHFKSKMISLFCSNAIFVMNLLTILAYNSEAWKCSSVQKKGMSWSICRKETWVACRSCWWRKMDKIDALQCIFNSEYFQSGVTWSTNVFCHRPVPVISVCLQPEMQLYTTDGQKMCLNFLGGKQIQIPDRSANSLQGPEKISQISLESFSFEKSLTI